jgi:glycosyltransferase involved in cell wall biosynthesis
MSQNNFVFIAPMFNAGDTLQRMLHSLYGQSHESWRLILIDDMSSDEHASKCENIIKNFSAFSDKIHLITNDEKRWEVANVLRGLSECSETDIVCRIDADDWLTDLDALKILDQVYSATSADAVWTAHRWGFTDQNISGALPDRANPYTHPWVSSHLKTFRKSIITGVNDENFRGENGQYIKRAGDQAIYLPVLHRAKKRVFVPRVMYHYTIDLSPSTFQTHDAKFQRDEAIFLRERGFVE